MFNAIVEVRNDSETQVKIHKEMGKRIILWEKNTFDEVVEYVYSLYLCIWYTTSPPFQRTLAVFTHFQKNKYEISIFVSCILVTLASALCFFIESFIFFLFGYGSFHLAVHTQHNIVWGQVVVPIRKKDKMFMCKKNEKILFQVI